MNHNLVAALMSRRVLTVAPETPLEEALAVMAREKVSSIVVAEGRLPCGVVTERDVVRLLSRGGPIRDKSCRDVMSAPVQAVSAGADYREAYHLLSEKGIRHLLVTDGEGGIVGMLTESDFMRHLGIEYFISLRNVGAAMTREVFTLPPEALLAEALLVMGTRRISCVVVAGEDGRPVGIVTERDAVSFSIDGIDPARVLLRSAMSAPVQTVTADFPLHEAVQSMEAAHIRRLVVVDGVGAVAGILTRHDVVKGLEGRYLRLLKETIERQRRELEQSRLALQGQSLADRIVNSAAETVILVADLAGRIIFCNPAAEPMLGFSPQTLAGRSLGEIYDAAGVAAPDFTALTEQLRRDGKASRLLVLPCRGRHLELMVSALRDEDEQLRGLLLVGLDATDRLREQEAWRLAAKIVDSIREGLMVTDAAGTIVSVNPAFTAITGYGRDEAVGRRPNLLSSRRQPASFYAELWRSLAESGRWDGEVWNRRKDGSVYPQRLEICALRDDAGVATHYIGMMTDLSEHKAVEQRLERLAYYDSLTGLPNRALFAEQSGRALALAGTQNEQVALLSVDLDLFKHINDTLGHSAGDQLLAACAHRIQQALGAEGTVARYAGDQFLVLLPVRQVAAVSVIAQQIVDSLHAPFQIEGSSLLVTASIGASLYPGDGADFGALVRNAEAAMYEAKQAGRDTFRFFDPAMNRRSRDHVEMQVRLRQALDREEFVLHYQPQFDMMGGRIVGVEALLRWQDPRQGLVAPGQFVPLAEESGLIVPIGAWVLRQACRQAKAWQAAGCPPVTVAVNLSALQFRRGDLFHTVVAALEESGLEPNRLELELTESILIHETERALGIVRELKALGVQLSIDDFGTGYSSLAYLKRFAVNKLKIDQSFVRDLETDLDDLAIVHAIVQMAHGLKLTVIAEGVETERQAELLRIARCDEVQGYHFGRPLTADALERLLRG